MTTTLERAIAARDALNESIAMMQSGELTADDMSEFDSHPHITMCVSPANPMLPTPRQEVLATVGDMRESREKFEVMQGRKRVAAITLNAAAQFIGLIAPLAGQLIRRGVGLAILLCLSLGLTSACSAQVGSDSDPLVQIGPTDQPVATATMDATATATVDVAATVEATATVQAPVDATLNIASPTATLTGTADIGEIGTDTTTQTTTQHNTSSAGGDNHPVSIVTTLNGSGWPVAFVVAVMVLGVVFSLWVRLSRQYDTLEANAQGAAHAIRDMGASPDRDRLLTLIRKHIADQQSWSEIVGAFDVSHEVKTT
jgi:hypothetical protein